MPYMETTSFCPWPTISNWNTCQIFMKFGTQVLYNELLKKVQFQENWGSERHTLLKSINEISPVFSTVFWAVKFWSGYVHKNLMDNMSFLTISNKKDKIYTRE